ncbi:restriction endonuclease [Streptomyces anulatus]|uniref:restriction endonuclease n=1 Tax=Streptomyces anulatus TaxID=1892 RepID=UPI002B1CCFE0|nr:restriction endonuclease [Streptomyces anulatus]
MTNWWVLVVLGACAAVGGAWWIHRFQQQQAWAGTAAALRYALPQLDALHRQDFEYAIRDLMRRDGGADARQIGGAGDNGADVLATDPMGRTWVIQCKHRAAGDRGSAVRTPDLQRVNGTARQLHGADIVLVVTNGRFSARCAPLAAQLICTWPTGGALRPGRAVDSLCGNCCRRFPAPARAGDSRALSREPLGGLTAG